MSLDATFQTQTVPYFQVAPAPLRDYDLLHVIPEYDLFGMSRPERKEVEEGRPNSAWGLPPTVKLYDVSPTPFYQDGEPSSAYELLLSLFKDYAPSTWTPTYIEDRMLRFLKNGVCYTDHTDPTAWNPIVTAGNVLYPTGRKENKGGELCWEVRQLKYGSLSFMQDQIAMYPLLVCFATNSTRENSGQHVEPFPHLGGSDVPAPLFCRQATNWIKASRVRLLDRAEPIPNLYHP